MSDSKEEYRTYVHELRDELFIKIKFNIAYNLQREGFFKKHNAVCAFLFLLLFLGCIITFFGNYLYWLLVCAVLAIIVVAVDNIVQIEKNAKIHKQLKIRWFSVLDEFHSINQHKFTENNYNQLNSEIINIEKDEPPPKEIIKWVSLNNVLVSLGRPPEFRIPFYLRIWGNYTNWFSSHVVISQNK